MQIEIAVNFRIDGRSIYRERVAPSHDHGTKGTPGLHGDGLLICLVAQSGDGTAFHKSASFYAHCLELADIHIADDPGPSYIYGCVIYYFEAVNFTAAGYTDRSVHSVIVIFIKTPVFYIGRFPSARYFQHSSFERDNIRRAVQLYKTGNDGNRIRGTSVSYRHCPRAVHAGPFRFSSGLHI